MTGESSEGASSAAAAEVTKPTRRNRGSTPPDEDRGGCPSVRDGGARVREGSGGCVGSGRRVVGPVSSGFRAHHLGGPFSFLSNVGLVVLDLLM
jgi:hypothetical protein